MASAYDTIYSSSVGWARRGFTRAVPTGGFKQLRESAGGLRALLSPPYTPDDAWAAISQITDTE